MISSQTDVTVIRATKNGTDQYNQPVLVWADSHVLSPCTVWQTATSEIPSVGRDQTVSDLTVHAPYGSDVLAIDRFRVGTDPDVFQVVGVPTQYEGLSGWQAGSVIQGSLVEG